MSTPAQFRCPFGVAVGPDGSVYVADYDTYRICKIEGSQVSTLAGRAMQPQFGRPVGVAVGLDGAVYAVDNDNHCIWKIEGNQVFPFAGCGTAGFADGPLAEAQFSWPFGIAVGLDGTLYVADYENQRIRRIQGSQVSTLAAWGESVDSLPQFGRPSGVAVGPDGTAYVADNDNHRIWKIEGNQVSPFAGCGTAGFADGAASEAKFNHPIGVAVGPDGTVFVADNENNRIRKISCAAEVSTVAGCGTPGCIDGDTNQAQFFSPSGVAVGPNGILYVADQDNHRIRMIHLSQVSTLAGSGR